MRRNWPHLLMASFLCSLLSAAAAWAEGESAALPAGVRAVWDLEKAERETTATRERGCINGLWRWQPGTTAQQAAGGGTGYCKLPGAWAGVNGYREKAGQAVWPKSKLK